MQILFYKLHRNFLNSFAGRSIFFHLGAIVLTYIIVISGFDWFYFTSAQNPILQILLFPAVIIGALIGMAIGMTVGKSFREILEN